MREGSFGDYAMLESIKRTATQFEAVDKAIVLDKNNNCLHDQSSSNLCLR
jgi:hypothetical protein